eukprot:COSAG02_NODE_123_length_35269_cov_51.697526_29_plen_208_part_00
MARVGVVVVVVVVCLFLRLAYEWVVAFEDPGAVAAGLGACLTLGGACLLLEARLPRERDEVAGRQAAVALSGWQWQWWRLAIGREMADASYQPSAVYGRKPRPPTKPNDRRQRGPRTTKAREVRFYHTVGRTYHTVGRRSGAYRARTRQRGLGPLSNCVVRLGQADARGKETGGRLCTLALPYRVASLSLDSPVLLCGDRRHRAQRP